MDYISAEKLKSTLKNKRQKVTLRVKAYMYLAVLVLSYSSPSKLLKLKSLKKNCPKKKSIRNMRYMGK